MIRKIAIPILVAALLVSASSGLLAQAKTAPKPKKDSTLYLEFDARPDLFNQPQSVSVYLGSQQVASFAADNKDPLLRRIPLRADILGTSDMAELRLVVEPTFIPSAIGAGQDIRELGIRVYHLFVDPS